MLITKGNMLFCRDDSITLTVILFTSLFTLNTVYLADVQIPHICLHASVVSSPQIPSSSSAIFCVIETYKQQQHSCQSRMQTCHFNYQFPAELKATSSFLDFLLTAVPTENNTHLAASFPRQCGCRHTGLY